MNIDELFQHKNIWVIEERNHEGISIIRQDDGQFIISAWAENWDDLWSWEGKILLGELVEIIDNPERARAFLQTEREWLVIPPYSVPRKSYRKVGCLDSSDGFRDGGTGGCW